MWVNNFQCWPPPMPSNPWALCPGPPSRRPRLRERKRLSTSPVPALAKPALPVGLVWQRPSGCDTSECEPLSTQITLGCWANPKANALLWWCSTGLDHRRAASPGWGVMMVAAERSLSALRRVSVTAIRLSASASKSKGVVWVSQQPKASLCANRLLVVAAGIHGGTMGDQSAVGSST